ncbi:MAG TPA: hypothetical protein VMF89_05615, partial [Polyangiales bacterium]|nr:hypothetical protein [Polyangiales bacterium]
LGKLPSDAELSALIERYAGSARVSCEQADLFFTSVGEDVTTRKSFAARARSSSNPPRDAAEVARGSWLDKLGPRSSAPPRADAEAAEPALSMAAPQPALTEEPITIEHGLEHLPATTYSSAPPPSALPSADTPVALPLSSRPAPQLTAAESVVVERWGMAETSPEPTMEVELAAGASADVSAPSSHDAQLSAEEDELLDRWSAELDETILGQSEASPQHPSSAPPPPSEAELHASTDVPERWSAPQLGGEVDETPNTVSDDDAPLSATELSLLEQWSVADPAESAPAQPITKSSRAPAFNLSSSRAPARSPSLRPSQLPPIPSSLRPPARSQPAPVAVASTADEELDMELDEAIELDPDDLIEDDIE